MNRQQALQFLILNPGRVVERGDPPYAVQYRFADGRFEFCGEPFGWRPISAQSWLLRDRGESDAVDYPFRVVDANFDPSKAWIF